MAEYWDVYDEHRNRTGALHRRGDPLGPGEYHLVVEIWTLDGQGRVLLTRRDLRKHFGGLWECTGGSAQAGEDSRTAVRRELREETGLDLGDAEPELLGTTKTTTRAFVDTYAVRLDFALSEIRLQEGETIEARLASFDEVERAILEGAPWLVSTIRERMLPLLPKLRAFRDRQ